MRLASGVGALRRRLQQSSAARSLYHGMSRGVGAVGGMLRTPYSRVHYVVDGGGWSIDWDGHYITSRLQSRHNVAATTTRNYRAVRRQVVHFGTRSSYLLRGRDKVHSSNRVVMTWFHGGRDDPNPDNQLMCDRIVSDWPRLAAVVTSTSLVRDRLLSWGVGADRLVTIPIGVDLGRFRPPTPEERAAARAVLEIPEGAFAIGSFQKDGKGWGDGLEPKYVKGPDIWLDVIREVHRLRPVFVVLTGPARGYVKNGLAASGIPFVHRELDRYEQIVRCYHALDAYLIASREEGGPKAVPECMATGVPLVSTRVGMAADWIVEGCNGFLRDVEDRGGLAAAVLRLQDDDTERRGVAKAGLETAQRLSWDAVADRYWSELYRTLLTGAGTG